MEQTTNWVYAFVALGFGVSAMVFGLPFYLIWTYHKRKLEEIKAKQRSNIDQETKAALDALRAEIASLRDTTTQYDVSFDTALRRIESRMGHVEQKLLTARTPDRADVRR
jgi:hypothetical protein